MKYIDPSKLIEVVDASRAENPPADLKIARNHRREHEHFIRMIVSAPAEDVAPVVHARWIVEFDDRGWKKYSCSGCGYFRRTDIHVSLNWHYCPNCGSKMDVEEYYNE